MKKLAKEERKKIELWAQGMKHLSTIENSSSDLNFVFEVVKNNETVPVILVDSADNIIYTRNLDSLKQSDTTYLKQELQIMKAQNPAIKIQIDEHTTQFIYYKESYLLTQLFYYPFIQLSVVFLFIIIAYLAFSASRRAEQNQVWVGMSKETAHQLGTPISSLLAWVELLKLKNADAEIIQEVDKDVKRLETITERFSKIGSTPKLDDENIYKVLFKAANYIKIRSSERVKFIYNFSENDQFIIPLNVPLFEWVIENLCKNAIDAMDGAGTINISVRENQKNIFIDVSDTGKGITKSKYKTVFNPGYTTKKRGWGLGLSLTKKIIEQYHKGKIFVLDSQLNIGTTFRIVLKK
jgi:signal transduction histidine kinase